VQSVTKSKKPKLSIVVSFRNEATNIPILWNRLKKSLETSGWGSFELIFVNDASSDNSQMTCENLALADHRIIVLNMTRVFGHAECVIAGFRYAKADLIAYMDADLQDPPELLVKLLEQQTETGLDVIHTKRVNRLGESLGKRIITSLGYFYLGKYMRPPIPREVGDFKLLTRRVVNQILKHSEPNPFLRGIIENLSFPSTFVEYERHARLDGRGRTKFPVLGRRWVRNHLNSTLISFSDAPLKFALLIGAVTGLLSFVSLPVFFYMKFSGLAVPGWSGIVILISFFGAINLLFLGVLGLYINSIFVATRNRPIFLIESATRKGKRIKLDSTDWLD
jgi:dolichol-phosphate mannosyltransferase